MKLTEAIRLVDDIKWKSIEKDNMEFEARATCFQKDAIKEVLEAAWKYNDLATS